MLYAVAESSTSYQHAQLLIRIQDNPIKSLYTINRDYDNFHSYLFDEFINQRTPKTQQYRSIGCYALPLSDIQRDKYRDGRLNEDGNWIGFIIVGDVSEEQKNTDHKLSGARLILYRFDPQIGGRIADDLIIREHEVYADSMKVGQYIDRYLTNEGTSNIGVPDYVFMDGGLDHILYTLPTTIASI